jgi:hypothetical protein
MSDPKDPEKDIITPVTEAADDLSDTDLSDVHGGGRAEMLKLSGMNADTIYAGSGLDDTIKGGNWNADTIYAGSLEVDTIHAGNFIKSPLKR